MTLNLNIDKKMFSPKMLPYITDYSHRWELWYGGAGSSKSYSITQKLIIRCCREKIRILVCRRYGSTIRNSCFALFKEVLAKWKLTEYVKIRETDFNIQFPNGSEIIFLGLDDENKLLSITNIGTIWVEEAYETTQSIIEQLDLRMRGDNKNQQIILSWNPISKASYLYELCELNPPENCVKIHSTFKDNPFLNKEYIATMEELLKRNPRKANIYYYGNWGTDAEGLVFSNWEVSEFDPMELAKTLQHRAGLDEGYTDPTAIVDTLYDKSANTIYVFNEFYKTGQTLDEIYDATQRMMLGKVKIYCDAADPRAINFLKSKGLNAQACIKGAGSVEARISFLQNHKIIVSPNCKSLINELENFAYEKDKKTGKLTDKTTHEFSHAIDALGYAYSDIYTKRGLGTMDKGALGL